MNRTHCRTLALSLLLLGAGASMGAEARPQEQVQRLSPSAPPVKRERVGQTLLSWPAPSARGLQDVSGLLHFHSPFSHDACDGEGLDEAGNPNLECLEDLRQDVCRVPHRFFFLSDHPTHMQEYAFEELFLYDPARGDVLLYDATGLPIANAFECETSAGPVTKYFMVGTEGNHNLLLGLDQHLEDPSYYSIGFGVEFDYNAQVEEIQQTWTAGGLATVAHLEEDEVTSYRLLALQVDGVELYNAHSNVEHVMSRYPWVLLDLESWVEGAVDAPTSDYVALAMFPYRRMEPETKWDEMTPTQPTTALIGTDVHQNVTLDAYCSMPELTALCQKLSRRYPNLVQYLEKGGPIPMADGERLDSYRRMSSWFSNHLRMGELAPGNIEETLLAGRSYIAFDILGLPLGFDFVGTVDGQHFLEMGTQTRFTAGLTLHLALPKLAGIDVRGESWSEQELSKAEVRGELLRVTASGTEVVATSSGAGAVLDHALTLPGVYRVRVYIRPLHLARELGTQKQYARDEYLWIWSNPIYVYE